MGNWESEVCYKECEDSVNNTYVDPGLVRMYHCTEMTPPPHLIVDV